MRSMQPRDALRDEAQGSICTVMRDGEDRLVEYGGEVKAGRVTRTKE